jgi:hypothetical protein
MNMKLSRFYHANGFATEGEFGFGALASFLRDVLLAATSKSPCRSESGE